MFFGTHHRLSSRVAALPPRPSSSHPQHIGGIRSLLRHQPDARVLPLRRYVRVISSVPRQQNTHTHNSRSPALQHVARDKVGWPIERGLTLGRFTVGGRSVFRSVVHPARIELATDHSTDVPRLGVATLGCFRICTFSGLDNQECSCALDTGDPSPHTFELATHWARRHVRQTTPHSYQRGATTIGTTNSCKRVATWLILVQVRMKRAERHLVRGDEIE